MAWRNPGPSPAPDPRREPVEPGSVKRAKNRRVRQSRRLWDRPAQRSGSLAALQAPGTFRRPASVNSPAPI